MTPLCPCMDGSLWIPLLDLCQVNINYYSKTNSESSKPGSGRICSSQKQRHSCHHCHSAGFQKYEKKCGRAIYKLSNMSLWATTLQTSQPAHGCQKVSADMQKVYLLFCISPSKLEDNRLKFRKSILFTIIWSMS